MRLSSARSSGGRRSGRPPGGGRRLPARPGPWSRRRAAPRGQVVDHVALTGLDVRAGVRLERVALAVELERRGAGDREEQLVAALLPARQRSARLEAGHVLLEPRRAGVRPEHDLVEGGVSSARRPSTPSSATTNVCRIHPSSSRSRVMSTARARSARSPCRSRARRRSAPAPGRARANEPRCACPCRTRSGRCAPIGAASRDEPRNAQIVSGSPTSVSGTGA